jgi:hypothetical protein
MTKQIKLELQIHTNNDLLPVEQQVPLTNVQLQQEERKNTLEEQKD